MKIFNIFKLITAAMGAARSCICDAAKQKALQQTYKPAKPISPSVQALSGNLTHSAPLCLVPVNPATLPCGRPRGRRRCVTSRP